MVKLKIKYQDPSLLQPWDNNARAHSDAQIDEIIASINEFGWTNPILLDEDALILAGHGRQKAALKMGLDQVPTILIKGLPDASKRAYVIADNQLALNATWDLDLLEIEIGELRELDFDIDLIGFEDRFVDSLFDSVNYSNSNTEVDTDDFDDLMVLKLKFSSEQYEAVRVALRKYGDSPEIALMEVLGL